MIHGGVEQGDEADEALGGTRLVTTVGLAEGAASCVPPLRGGTHRLAAYRPCWADMKWSATRGDMTVRGRGVIAGAVAGWWSYVVVDFAIHAVVLESWWRSTQSYWIPPVEMARRIPFAYLAFAMYCLGLSWVGR